MVNINDYIDENGKVNWPKFQQAKRDYGEICYNCDGYILYNSKTNTPSLCSSCNSLKSNPEEVYSKQYIRCPYCSYQIEIDLDYYQCYEEGEHEVSCTYCEADFIIETSITYTFRSPKLNEKSNI